jgi:hypothetical protein
MTTQAKMEAFKTIAANRGLHYGRSYVLWTVGRFKTIHVTCKLFARSTCEYAADELIKKYGGVRYSTIVNSLGLLGAANEVAFCLKLSNKGVVKQ